MPDPQPVVTHGPEKTYRRPISVLVYCFRRHNGDLEYLMLRRTPKYGRFWQGVTGALEKGESLIDAAHRELMEETSISCPSLWQTEFHYSFALEEEWKWAYHPDVNNVDEFVFLAEVPNDTDPVLSFEHDTYFWVPFAEALALLYWPNNKDSLQQCDSQLRSRFS